MTLPKHAGLTPREAQVLQRLIEGSTTREISVSYGIAHQTVKNYVTVIYEKLGVRGRHQLFEVRHGRPVGDGFRRQPDAREPSLPTPAAHSTRVGPRV